MLAGAAMGDQIQAQREQLFRVMAITQCCKCAMVTSMEVLDPEYVVTALEAVYDQLDQIAGRLGVVADDLRLVPKSRSGVTLSTNR